MSRSWYKTQAQREWEGLPLPARLLLPYPRSRTLTEKWQDFWSFTSADFFSGVAIMFAIVVVVALHWRSILPGIHPGDDMVINAIAIVWWIVWNIVLCGLIAWPLTLILPLLSNGARWAVCLIILLGPLAYLAGWFFFHEIGERNAARNAAAAYEATQRIAEQQAAEQEALEHKLAEERARQLAALNLLRMRVTAKWRGDLEHARATGEPGIVPPMLSIKQAGTRISVTNKGVKPACVQLQRVASHPEGFERCVIGSNSCTPIDSGATRQFQIFRSGNPAGCLNAPLEFRVGTPAHPEPSWWSRTALEDLERSAPDAANDARLSTGDIPAETTRLETLLTDDSRAARWKRELRRYDSRVEAE